MDRSTKVCPRCCRQLPASEFRHKNGAGSPRSCCATCNVEYHRSYRRRRREERLGKFVSAVNRSRRNRATYRLVEATARAFGSPERLAEAWHQDIEEARQRRPGSAEVLRAYRAIVNLGIACETAKGHAKPQDGILGQQSFRDWLKTATDEELEEAIAQQLARIVGQCQDDPDGPDAPEDDLTPAAPEADPAEDAGLP